MITLDSIREAADAKYGSYDISLGNPENPVRLMNPLRLSEAKRAELRTVQNDMDATDEDEDQDQTALFERAIRAVTETDGQADALLGAVNGDLALLAEIFAGYSAGTQVGEASASAA